MDFWKAPSDNNDPRQTIFLNRGKDVIFTKIVNTD